MIPTKTMIRIAAGAAAIFLLLSMTYSLFTGIPHPTADSITGVNGV